MGAFNKEYPVVVDALQTECHLFHTDNAMWDTGATTTIISSRIVRQLGLKPYQHGGISGIGGESDTNTYLVHLMIPTGDVVTNCEVMESDFEDYDVIIGMDIISLGDFCFTNPDDKSVFSFRIPAKEKIILQYFTSFFIIFL